MRNELLLACALALAALPACKTLECGENTVEQDGECVAMAGPTGTQCGPGTHYDTGTGRCESDLFSEGGGVCGEGTTATVNDAGVRVCVGAGGGGTNCAAALPCPAPTTENSVSLCGRIFDLEDSSPLDDGDAANGEPHKTVELRVVDPFAFIANPNTAPLARAYPDACGRYRILDAPRSPAGHPFLAIAVDDIVDTGTGQPLFGDNLVTAGIGEELAAGAVRASQRAWILRRTTDESWSAGAGLTGMTFGQRGVYIPIFLSGSPVAPFANAPTENVMTAVIEGTGRTVKPENDFYFDDASATDRKVVNPSRTQTGRNGSGLYINQSAIVSFSGVGATPEGSCWAINPAAAPPGAAFVQERLAEPRFCQ
jgi:hypothetical protein